MSQAVLTHITESVVRATTQVNGGNGKFDPLPLPNPLTDRHQRLHMIRSWISNPHAKFIRDPLRVSFPRMREIGRQRCLLGLFFAFFKRSTAEAPEPIFTHNTSNYAAPRKDVSFWG